MQRMLRLQQLLREERLLRQLSPAAGRSGEQCAPAGEGQGPAKRRH